MALLLGSGSLEFLSEIEPSTAMFVAAVTQKKRPKASFGKRTSGQPSNGATKTKKTTKKKTVKKSPDGDERTSERKAKEAASTEKTKGTNTKDTKSAKDTKNAKGFLAKQSGFLTAAAAVSAAVFLPLGFWGFSGSKKSPTPSNKRSAPISPNKRSAPTPLENVHKTGATPPNYVRKNVVPPDDVPANVVAPNNVPKNVVPPKPAPSSTCRTTGTPGLQKENEKPQREETKENETPQKEPKSPKENENRQKNPQKEPQQKREETEEEREETEEEKEEQRKGDERLQQMTETQAEKAREEKERRRQTRSEPIAPSQPNIAPSQPNAVPSQPITPNVATATIQIGEQQNLVRDVPLGMECFMEALKWGKECVENAYHRGTGWAADKYDEAADAILGELESNLHITLYHRHLCAIVHAPVSEDILASEDAVAKKAFFQKLVFQMLEKETQSLPNKGTIKWSTLGEHIVELKKVQVKYHPDKAYNFVSSHCSTFVKDHPDYKGKRHIFKYEDLKEEDLKLLNEAMTEASQIVNDEVGRLSEIMTLRQTWKDLGYPQAVFKWTKYYNLQQKAQAI